MSTDGGAETPAIDEDPGKGKWMEPTNWTVVGPGIYFLEGKPGNPDALKFFDFETRRTTVLMTLGGRGSTFVMVGLTVAPDGRSMLYAQRDKIDLDLMLVEDFH